MKYAEAVVEEGSSPLICRVGIIEGTPSLLCEARVGRMLSLLPLPLAPPYSECRRRPPRRPLLRPTQLVPPV